MAPIEKLEAISARDGAQPSDGARIATVKQIVAAARLFDIELAEFSSNLLQDRICFIDHYY